MISSHFWNWRVKWTQHGPCQRQSLFALHLPVFYITDTPESLSWSQNQTRRERKGKGTLSGLLLSSVASATSGAFCWSAPRWHRARLPSAPHWSQKVAGSLRLTQTVKKTPQCQTNHSRAISVDQQSTDYHYQLIVLSYCCCVPPASHTSAIAADCRCWGGESLYWRVQSEDTQNISKTKTGFNRLFTVESTHMTLNICYCSSASHTHTHKKTQRITAASIEVILPWSFVAPYKYFLFRSHG